MHKHQKCAYEYLPFFTFWEVWKARNVSLFSNTFQRMKITYAKTLSSVLEWNREKPVKRSRDLSPPLFLRKLPLLLFDNAAANGFCGAGFVFKLAQGVEIKGWLNARTGSNTRAKIIGLWSSLFVARWWSLRDLYVAGHLGK